MANDTSIKLYTVAVGRKRSIQSHLVALGAPHDEVYATKQERNQFRKHENCCTKRNKVLDSMSRAEVLGWAEWLYKKRLTEWHPDRHLGEKERYTRMCQELGQEFVMLCQKLQYHPYIPQIKNPPRKRLIGERKTPKIKRNMIGICEYCGKVFLKRSPVQRWCLLHECCIEDRHEEMRRYERVKKAKQRKSLKSESNRCILDKERQYT